MRVVGGKGLRKPLAACPSPGGDHARMPGSIREPANEEEEADEDEEEEKALSSRETARPESRTDATDQGKREKCPP